MRAGPALTNRASLRPVDTGMAGPEVSTLLPPGSRTPWGGGDSGRARYQCWLGGPAGPSLSLVTIKLQDCKRKQAKIRGVFLLYLTFLKSSVAFFLSAALLSYNTSGFSIYTTSPFPGLQAFFLFFFLSALAATVLLTLLFKLFKRWYCNLCSIKNVLLKSEWFIFIFFNSLHIFF